jgi:hypothetical protein
MRPAPDWMNRDHPSYDPNRIGAISEARIIAALIEAGKVVLESNKQVLPFDLAVYENGRFVRVQCKTGRVVRGAVYFRPHRLRAARRETGWQRRVTSYLGEVDAFAVYCPETGDVYLVPIEDINTQQVCTLRLDPAKNNQTRRVRWAAQYLVGAQPAPTSVEITPQPGP